jgi:hypothetical protein
MLYSVPSSLIMIIQYYIMHDDPVRLMMQTVGGCIMGLEIMRITQPHHNSLLDPWPQTVMHMH